MQIKNRILIVVVLAFFLVGASFFVVVEVTNHRPKARCEFFKDSKGYLVADCTNKALVSIPEIKETDVEVSCDVSSTHIDKFSRIHSTKMKTKIPV